MTGMENITTTSHDQCMNPVHEQAAVGLQKQNKPDIVVLDKINRKCLIIDVACAFDIRVKGEEKEEI